MWKLFRKNLINFQTCRFSLSCDLISTGLMIPKLRVGAGTAPSSSFNHPINWIRFWCLALASLILDTQPLGMVPGFTARCTHSSCTWYNPAGHTVCTSDPVGNNAYSRTVNTSDWAVTPHKLPALSAPLTETWTLSWLLPGPATQLCCCWPSSSYHTITCSSH